MKYEIIKGSEKDFEGAPEWAHYLAERGDGAVVFSSEKDDKYKYVKDPYGQSGMEFKGTFISYRWSDGIKIIAERRPVTEPVVWLNLDECDGSEYLGPAWDGAGLPPVGVECEMSYAGDEWRKCTIIAKGSEQIIFKQDGCREFSGHKNNYKFRPIRSPEDVARDEVKAAIAELCRSSASNGHSADLICDAIAAGKIPGIEVKLAVSVDDMWRAFEKSSDMEDVHKLIYVNKGKP